MRGYKDFNFPAFEKAMHDLQGRGIKVTSPHKMDLNEGFDPKSSKYEGTFREETVRRDVEAIIQSDGVVFLPGWTNSVGSMAEYHVALWLEKPCYQYPELHEF